MQSNIILAAITAAAIAQHIKKDYAVMIFNSEVCILKDELRRVISICIIKEMTKSL